MEYVGRMIESGGAKDGRAAEGRGTPSSVARPSSANGRKGAAVGVAA